MRRHTEEILNLLFYAAELFARPTFRNPTGSYESWAYRKGFFKQLHRLEKQGMLEGSHSTAKDRLYRLSEPGRLKALGGRDPLIEWARKWDGQWRLILFDVPISRNTDRTRLRRYLQNSGFGCLQGSVWITPHEVSEQKRILAAGKIDVNSLVMLEARPASGETDAEIVAGAWDFSAINRRYEKYLEFLSIRPKTFAVEGNSTQALEEWATQEHQEWIDATRHDPFLPECLLPPDYLGNKAFRERMRTIKSVGKQFSKFWH